MPDGIDNDLLQEYLNIKVFTPKKGKLKKLIDMEYENAKVVLEEKEELIKRNKEFEELDKYVV